MKSHSRKNSRSQLKSGSVNISEDVNDIVLEERRDSTLEKFIRNQPYTVEDMAIGAWIVNTLNRTRYPNMNSTSHFAVLDRYTDLAAKLTAYLSSKILRESPLFIVYNKAKSHWIVLCILDMAAGEADFYCDPVASKIVVLVKDSLGIRPQFGFTKTIEDVIACDILHSNSAEQCESDKYISGALCLRNLKIMCDRLQATTVQRFVDDFKQGTIAFATGTHIDQAKQCLLLKLEQELNNEPFLTALRSLVKSLEDGLPVCKCIADYRQILVEVCGKANENDDENVSEVSMRKIEHAKNSAINRESVNQLAQTYRCDSVISNDDFKLDIEKQYKREMRAFKLFCWLMKDIRSEAYVDELCQVLNIDSSVLSSFEDKCMPTEDSRLQSRPSEISVKPFIDVIKTSANTVTTVPDSDQLGICSTFDEVLEKLDIHCNTFQQQENIKRRIGVQYTQVQEHFERRWSNASCEDVTQWAASVKGTQWRGDEGRVCEALAVMNRANELVTGCRLRIPQIVAVLLLVNNCPAGYGMVLQVSTGEGKTIIISLLACTLALQGEVVDVITSNSLLADEAVATRMTFYSLFSLTVASNSDKKHATNFNQLSNAKVNPNESTVPNVAYKADVLYGTISNFQFDYLRDGVEGSSIRHNRSFGYVIIDEIDSMLIDSGGHVAKLAEPFPGMEYLKHVYIRIWWELTKAENTLLHNLSDAAALAQFAITEKKLTDAVLRSNPLNIDILPSHLKSYAENKLHKWISSAIHARYCCFESQQYRIVQVSDKAGKQVDTIVPVDSVNTGVSLLNTVWSDGLHQFLQLKHNLSITSESLTSSYISNLSYICKYGEKLFGLTGTLGSETERNLLSEAYTFQYGSLPTFRPKIFEEFLMIVSLDEDWDATVAIEAMDVAFVQKRAVLVICQSIADVNVIAENLHLLGIDGQSIKLIRYEDEAVSITQEAVTPGTVIVATNLAGRGTDLSTSPPLDIKGGLHVIVAFLPCNKRVEDQAFGRTSRQGKMGSAQIIMRHSEMLALNCDRLEEVKIMRDNKERDRLDYIRQIRFREIIFRDFLHDQFATYYREFMPTPDEQSNYFVKRDLKEFWATWLELQTFSAEDLHSLNRTGSSEELLRVLSDRAKREFITFLSQPAALRLTTGIIAHNPFYSIMLAEHHIRNNRYDLAKQALHWIDSEIQNDSSTYFGAYIKLFELSIEDGHQLMERLKKAIGKLFFISVQPNGQYKKIALSHLRVALKGIARELDYMRVFYNPEFNEDFKFVLEDIELSNTAQQDNELLRELYSRMSILEAYQVTIQQLADKLENRNEADKIQTSGLALRYRVPDKLAMLTTLNISNEDTASPQSAPQQEIHQQQSLHQPLQQAQPLRASSEQVNELRDIGCDVLYALKDVHDASSEVIHLAQAQIGAGIGALVAGLAVPPALPILGNLAGTLIAEGISDVVIELLSKGDNEFNWKIYARGKAITYGIAIVTMGLTAISSCRTIMQKAINACRSMSGMLKNSKYFTKLCINLAQILEKIALNLEAAMAFRSVANISAKFGQNAARAEAMKSVAWTVGERVGVLLSTQSIAVVCSRLEVHVKAVTHKKLKPMFMNYLDRKLAHDKVKLCSVASSDIYTESDNLLKNVVATKILTMVKQLVPLLEHKVKQHMTEWQKWILTAVETVIIQPMATLASIPLICECYCQELIAFLNRRYSELAINATGSGFLSSVDDMYKIVVEQLADKLTDHANHLILGCISSTLHNAVNVVTSGANLYRVSLQRRANESYPGTTTTQPPSSCLSLTIDAGIESNSQLHFDNSADSGHSDCANTKNPSCESREYFQQYNVDTDTTTEEAFSKQQRRLALKFHPLKHPDNIIWAQAEYSELQRHCDTVRANRNFTSLPLLSLY